MSHGFLQVPHPFVYLYRHFDNRLSRNLTFSWSKLCSKRHRNSLSGLEGSDSPSNILCYEHLVGNVVNFVTVLQSLLKFLIITVVFIYHSTSSLQSLRGIALYSHRTTSSPVESRRLRRYTRVRSLPPV